MKTRSYLAVIALLSAAIPAAIIPSGCSGGDVSALDTIAKADSLPPDSVLVDSVSVEEEVEEVPMPKAADELFDDFFFNFASSARLQRERVTFPLPVMVGEERSEMKKKDWQTDRFFLDDGFYTLIIDSPDQLETMKDTAITTVSVERIHIDDGYVTGYRFERKNGLWRMVSITHDSIAANHNASFLVFYERFTTDTAFQIASIQDPMQIVEADIYEDDEGEDMSGLIAPEQWPMFDPGMPSGTIYNIVYGEPLQGSDKQKLFIIRGISNGLEMELSFRHKEGRWMLTKMTM